MTGRGPCSSITRSHYCESLALAASEGSTEIRLVRVRVSAESTVARRRFGPSRGTTRRRTDGFLDAPGTGGAARLSRQDSLILPIGRQRQTAMPRLHDCRRPGDCRRGDQSLGHLAYIHAPFPSPPNLAPPPGPACDIQVAVADEGQDLDLPPDGLVVPSGGPWALGTSAEALKSGGSLARAVVAG